MSHIVTIWGNWGKLGQTQIYIHYVVMCVAKCGILPETSVFCSPFLNWGMESPERERGIIK